MRQERKKRLRDTWNYYKGEGRSVLVTYLILRFIVILALALSLVEGNFDSAFICVLVLFLFLLPAFLKGRLSIELPSTLEIIIIVFIFAAEILGELSNYYVRYPYWDTLLHTTWGFLCAAVGYSLVDVLNRSERIKFDLSPLFLAIVAFCFSMTIGVLWEFFEFTIDRVLRLDMQKDTVIHAFSSVSLDPTLQNIPVLLDNITEVSVDGVPLGLGGYLDIGLYDTMEDLFVNFIGALVFSFVGYFDAKTKGGSKLAAELVPRLRHETEEGEPSIAEKSPVPADGEAAAAKGEPAEAKEIFS